MTVKNFKILCCAFGSFTPVHCSI